jgi:AraC family transcriptional activator of pobA
MASKNLPIYNIEQFKYLGKEADFYTNTLAIHLKQYPFILTPHKHSFFFVAFCTKGSGIHTIDFVDYEVKPGTVFFLSPGQAHSWKLSDDVDGYIFFHSKGFYESIFRSEKVQDYPFFCSIYNPPLVFVKNKDLEKTANIFREILLEYQANEKEPLMKYKKINFLIGILYIDLSRIYLPQKKIAKQKQTHLIKLRTLEDLIEAHFQTVKTPGQYAEMVHMSEKNLNRICKENLDKTVSDLIFDRIILEAKRMLIHGEFSIREISAELGYLDNSYFTRLFKKKTGETPSEFIGNYRKN